MDKQEYIVKGRDGDIEFGFKVGSPNRWFVRKRSDGVVRFLGAHNNHMSGAFASAQALNGGR